MSLEIITLYSPPTLLYVIGVVLISVLCWAAWRVTDRHYTEIAEDYYNREYPDYSDRLDNIVKTNLEKCILDEEKCIL